MPKLKLANTPAPSGTPLTQIWFWTRVSSWFKESDVIITETGTAAHGILETRFPNNVVGISQILWGSIDFPLVLLLVQVWQRKRCPLIKE